MRDTWHKEINVDNCPLKTPTLFDTKQIVEGVWLVSNNDLRIELQFMIDPSFKRENNDNKITYRN